MHDLQKRFIRATARSTLFAGVGCAAIALFLTSCSTDLAVQREAQPTEGPVPVSPYSIVCVIHGDGDYLYHDTSGNEYRADEEAVAAAQRVARHNPEAEVFIFHQKPRRHMLFFFPLRDGEFYYYRSGRLIANELYWRDQKETTFDREVELYRRFHAGNRSGQVSVFLYCGHAIPEFGGAGYDASYPDRTFTIRDLAGGLKDLTRDSTRFDLMVLSTCFGGTPYTIGSLGSFARTIVASPENLHLSYFDLQPLERLDLGLRDRDVPDFARRFARSSFERLAREVQTAVSVAVYDVDRVQEFLRSVQTRYANSLTILKASPKAALGASDRCDCAGIPAFVLPSMAEGVDVFYRPARFGRLKLKQSHSGWECWNEKAPQAAEPRVHDPELK